MGYTHYWDNNIHAISKVIDWNQAIKDCKKIIKASPVPLEEVECNIHNIVFNGAGEDAHDTFLVSYEGENSFCKTAIKPYDLIVVAILTRLAEINGFDVSSDGETDDWNEGIAFASKVLKRELKCPLE